MNFPKEVIKKAAEVLSSNMVSYIHKETHEVDVTIDSDHMDYEEELWGEGNEKIEKSRDEYVKIPTISSRESFQIVVGFAEEVTDSKIRNQLFEALDKRKPFRNFKDAVGYHEELRQAWFKFEEAWKIQWVTNYLENID